MKNRNFFSGMTLLEVVVAIMISFVVSMAAVSLFVSAKNLTEDAKRYSQRSLDTQVALMHIMKYAKTAVCSFTVNDAMRDPSDSIFSTARYKGLQFDTYSYTGGSTPVYGALTEFTPPITTRYVLNDSISPSELRYFPNATITATSNYTVVAKNVSVFNRSLYCNNHAVQVTISAGGGSGNDRYIASTIVQAEQSCAPNYY